MLLSYMGTILGSPRFSCFKHVGDSLGRESIPRGQIEQPLLIRCPCLVVLLLLIFRPSGPISEAGQGFG
jgi:hypothetical protein